MEVLEEFDRARVERLLAAGERFWLRLRAPEPAVLHELGDLLGLNPLAVQDSIEFGQRPKLDDYPGSALLVFYGARTDDTPDGPIPRPVEFHFHVTGKAIVTVRRRSADAVGDVRRRVGLDDIDTTEEALYRVLDALAASFGPSIRLIDEEVRPLEDIVMENPKPDDRRRLLDIKHALVRLRQVVDPQRDVLAGRRDLLDQLPGFHDERAHDTLRDVYDRLAVVSQQLDSVRESLSNTLDLYVSAVSNRLNEIMKVLTVVATFFLPLTFVTGFFGQNFGWMVRHVDTLWAFLVLGVGIILAIVAALAFWFLRAGYLPAPRPWRTPERPPPPRVDPDPRSAPAA